MTSSTNSRKSAPKASVALALLASLLLGAGLRLYNVNWDAGTYHIHPDERHTTMVITRIEWPASMVEYFDTSHSPLNPRNKDTVYFYGTLPLFLTKFVATQLDAAAQVYINSLPNPAEYQIGYIPFTSYDRIHLVGRVLSALFDLGSVLFLFFLARRLFDWRVGLLASALLALTALHIQGAHYFTVDTFLTFFVLLTIWFSLDVAEGKGWPAFAGLGLAMGLTLSCKVSVFLLAAVVGLGAWLGLRRRLARGQEPGRASLLTVGGLLLAVVLSLGVFRVAQPYAWAGPNYDGWDSVPAPWSERLRAFAGIPEPIRAVAMPNPRWIADILEAGAQQTGEADLPWGRQWTERTPWLFPLENMVLWGMGLPLGVASWLGVGLVLAQILRTRYRRRPEHRMDGNLGFGHWSLVIVPLAWVLLTFFWQGMQYVKSIRYFLPIYPYLVTFAAYLAVSAWDLARASRGWQRALTGAVALLVPLGALAWALAFVQIYTEPVTRVQATRWIYQNVESAATLHYRTGDGETGKLQLPLPSVHIYAGNGQFQTTAFAAPRDLIATEVVMNDLSALEEPTEGEFEVAILDMVAGNETLAEARFEATFAPGDGGRYVVDLPDAALRGGRTYYFQSRAVRGAPLVSQGAAIANEHFDDPLPFNMDGYVAFGGGLYRGLDLTLYDEDTPEKLEQLLNILDEADYISMSSGRLWQSIPRLPMRYPVTTRYYELLFAGELGFEKAAEFHSYPRLFGLEFDDTWAEEQFTVYDHPKVLIYRKTEEYDRERVRTQLSEGIDWANIPHWLNPRDVPAWRREQEQGQRQAEVGQSVEAGQNDLKLTEAQRRVQEAGGTWASIFRRNSLPNRWPVVSWYALVGLLGLAALPLTAGLLRRLPDRGLVLARPVGVLLLAWLSWMLTNLTALHYSRSTILLAFGLIAAASLASLLVPGQRRRLADLWRSQKGLILVSEALFLAAFLLFLAIRWGNPDLWHPWKGGEKPMDFAYLNAIIKSTEFPPYDPWFSGGYLNYYYFGQVMVGTLIKLIGIVPSVAYNLAIPTWFAMLVSGAFGLTYNLVARGHRLARRAVVFGLVGALFVAVLGNLGQIHLILLSLGEGILENFESTIPGLAGLVRTVVGTFEVMFGGRALPIGLDEWYWNASRAIPAGPYEAVITEFPFFTFLYGDLHAHLIAMPLTFVSLAAALAMVKAARGPARQHGSLWLSLGASLGLLGLWALAIGAMRTTNTWDVPPHLLVALGALGIAEFSRRDRTRWQAILAILFQFAILFALGWSLLYWPFWTSYGSFYEKIGLWPGTRTPIWAYLVVHGLFLFLITSYLLARTVGRGAGQRPAPWLRRLWLSLRYRHKSGRLARVARLVGVRGLPVGAWAWLLAVLLVLALLLLAVPGLLPFARPHAEFAASGDYAYRGLAVFVLGLPLGLIGLLLLLRRDASPSERFWTYLVLLGLAMSLGVEVIVVQGDIGRMNTVFKFYLQVWLMWGVAAAAALAWLLPHLRRWPSGRAAWLGVLAALVFFAALYPPLATMAKVRDRFDPELGGSLDGWDYMETATYWDPNGGEYDLKWDLEAIRWFLDFVVGSPVILEGHTPEYRWGGRYSINTGLPTVLGWNWHQRQQRAAANDGEVWQRASDVATIYDTSIPELADSLLVQYRVRYVIVGPLERTYYSPAGLKKFEWLVAQGTLRVAYSNEKVTIYEVVP